MKSEGIKPFDCPRCGFNYFEKYDYSAGINNLLKERNTATRMDLRTVAQLIKTNVPSDAHRDKYFFFLNSIKGVNDGTLRWGLMQYFQGKHYLQGKGYAYMKSIILSRKENKKKIAENERKMRGSSPPVIKQKGVKYG